MEIVARVQLIFLICLQHIANKLIVTYVVKMRLSKTMFSISQSLKCSLFSLQLCGRFVLHKLLSR